AAHHRRCRCRDCVAEGAASPRRPGGRELRHLPARARRTRELAAPRCDAPRMEALARRTVFHLRRSEGGAADMARRPADLGTLLLPGGLALLRPDEKAHSRPRMPARVGPRAR